MDQITAPQTFDLAIGGMTCASCVLRVEKSLSKVPGVTSVAVNLGAETAHLEASATTELPALIAAVEKAGYLATARAAARPQIGHRELYELIAAAILSAPLLLGMLLRLPGWVEFALATPVQFWLGARFYRAGFKAARAGAGNMDLLVALGTSAAYCLSAYDYIVGTGPLYFESSAVVITLIRLGKYLEGRAKRDAAKAVSSLTKLRPSIAHVLGKADVPLAAVQRGDVLELRPGERVPVDGIILEGMGSFDESHITGESLPVVHAAGSTVLAGAMNLDAVLPMRVTSQPGETLLDRMARLIDAAQSSKPKVQRLADQIAAVFVPIVLVIALITFGGWLIAGASMASAIINAVSVMVIACPCALGLATPAAILAGTGVAARHGILIRNADALEHAARVNFVVFDKTGTLTEGKPKLIGAQSFGLNKDLEALEIAASLSAADTHPLSAALRRADAKPAESVRALPGRGVEGVVDGVRYILGSQRLIEDAGGTIPAATLPATATISYLALANGQVLAGFAFADTLRSGCSAAIARLGSLGCKVMLLSGDRSAAATAIGAELGISEIIAEASPEQKLTIIAAKRAAGLVVAMVGDGVNDAPALAEADVGIAIGTGADVALETADFALLRPEPMLVADALYLSRKIWSTLRQGLFWAMIYNLVGIPLAAFGILSPMVAGAAMAASSVCVLGNALRLTRWSPS
ncbi:MAG: heavy metal translocating P-type ATPase [Acidocella sp.]|nr:heavy metal translocating P-type ATPase [Acidocella sp.]